MSTFNEYYQDELSYLRELGLEFARAYPAIAPMLAERGDPDVERLLEGVAFLTGKLRQKVDDELPELMHGVAGLLFPHYLRPIPATTIVAFSPLAGAVRERVLVPRGAEVGSVPVDGVSCRFRTTQEVALAPLAVEAAELVSGVGRAATLRVELRVTSGAAFGALELDELHFYIHGERRFQDDLRLALGARAESLALASLGASGRETIVASLPATALTLTGFDEAEALLPYPSMSFSGYRLLQEFFTLPQKFAFFRVSGLRAASSLKEGDRLVLLIHLREGLPPGARVTRESVRLFCTPAVNLFEQPIDPLKFDAGRQEYLVRASGGPREAFELYSVDRVTAVARRSGQRTELAPFYSFAHELDAGRGDAPLYYQTHLRPAAVGDGVDVYLSFGSPEGATRRPDVDAIALEATCTNRRLAAELKVGDLRVPTASSPALATFANLCTVTTPLPPPFGRELEWRVLAHMAMGYRSLAELEVLRGVIDLYNFHGLVDRQAARANQLRLAALRELRVRPVDRLYRGAPVRGVGIELELDEGGFSGEGELHLFASILDELFAAYVSVNSFSQLTATTVASRAVYRWQPKSGPLTLL